MRVWLQAKAVVQILDRKSYNETIETVNEHVIHSLLLQLTQL